MITKCPKCDIEFDNRGKCSLLKFCSRKCANSRTWSDKQKLQKSQSLKNSKKYQLQLISRREKQIKKKCPICHKTFCVSVRRTNKIYCTRKCYLLDSPPKFRKVNKNPIPHGDSKKAWGTKTGYYKGIYCGSSYELAYLIYCIDNSINIKRCTEKFKMKDGHYYFPDFICDDTIIEIKGYATEKSKIELKQEAVKITGQKYKILYTKDLNFVFKYLSQKLKKNITYWNVAEIVKLYDNYKPQYQYTCDYCKKLINTEIKRKSKTDKYFCRQRCAGLSAASKPRTLNQLRGLEMSRNRKKNNGE